MSKTFYFSLHYNGVIIFLYSRLSVNFPWHASRIQSLVNGQLVDRTPSVVTFTVDMKMILVILDYFSFTKVGQSRCRVLPLQFDEKKEFIPI